MIDPNYTILPLSIKPIVRTALDYAPTILKDRANQSTLIDFEGE